MDAAEEKQKNSLWLCCITSWQLWWEWAELCASFATHTYFIGPHRIRFHNLAWIIGHTYPSVHLSAYLVMIDNHSLICAVVPWLNTLYGSPVTVVPCYNSHHYPAEKRWILLFNHYKTPLHVVIVMVFFGSITIGPQHMIRRHKFLFKSIRFLLKPLNP